MEKAETVKDQLPQVLPNENDVKTLLEWKSPSRTLISNDKEFYSTIIALALLVSIVFFFIKEFLLIVVIWAGVFFLYALSNLPVEEADHKITTQGITSLGHPYPWEELGPFWFTNSNSLKILTQRGITRELVIILGKADKEKIKEILVKYLPFWDNPQKSFSDKASEWLTKKLSFEKTPKVS